jgi:hypothetical protein
MSGPVEEVHVERLSLRVAGLDEDAARALSRLVAEGLAPVLGRASAGTGLDHLRIEVPAGSGAAAPGTSGSGPTGTGSAGGAGAHAGTAPAAGTSGTDSLDLLAARIVDQVGRTLARDRAFGPLGEEGTL